MNRINCLVVALFAFSASANAQETAALKDKGEYLARAGDCVACHSVRGGKAFAGGLRMGTPMGAIYSTNITPDPDTGIGNYSLQDFDRAVRSGIAKDGHRLYPAMPYPSYAKISDQDIQALYTFFMKDVPPVKQANKPSEIPWYLGLRWPLAIWNAVFAPTGPYVARADRDAAWNRGAYLVEGLMHCGACHTPKNLAGGDKNDARFHGYALQGWFAPDLTTDPRRGIGSWSADDLVAYLKTGHNRFAAATGPMADVVSHSTSRMTDADLHAVATYLKGQPASQEKSPQPIAASDPAMRAGAAIYADECSACHTPSGRGVPNLFPRLAGAPSVQSTDPTSLIRVVLAGTRSVATDDAPTAPAMPAFGHVLGNREAAAVLTYIRNAWGNAAPPVSAGDIATHRDRLVKTGG